MSKALITAIGLVASLGIIALAIAFVALPVYVQSLGVDAQTATVSSTNDIYQAQVDGLEAEKENLDEVNASVEQLRQQIPSSGQLDDVFEVIGRAASATGVGIASITAGESASFASPTDAAAAEDTSVEPDPSATPSPTDDGSGTTVEPTPDPVGAPVGGRQQVDFSIQVGAADVNQVTAFLDALRAGPRLLSIVTTTTSQTSGGTFDVQISALTYVDAEG